MAVAEDEPAGQGVEAFALSSVVHDLENLLGAMGVRADLVERQLAEGDQGAAKSNIDVVRRGIEESRRLTASLKSIIRREVPATRAVDVAGLLDQLAPLLDAMVDDHVKLERSISPSLPLVQVTQLGLRRVLLNLVVNATEALADSPGTVRISADEADRDGRGGVELVVSDTGPGMAPEILVRATEPEVSSKLAGSGLGLTTVAEVVEASRGNLEIGSEPGEGCRVAIWLPAVGAS